MVGWDKPVHAALEFLTDKWEILPLGKLVEKSVFRISHSLEDFKKI